MSSLGHTVYRAGRALSRWRLLQPFIPEQLRARIQSRLLPGAMSHLADRRYMDEVLLPAMAAFRPGRVLDIGLEEYSAGHRRHFDESCEYWTLDLNPVVATHGAPGRHVVADVRELEQHFARESLDLVILNGVFGFGIDDPDGQEEALAAIGAVLRRGGWLLVGWDRASDGLPLVMSPQGLPRLRDPIGLARVTGFAHRAPHLLPARIEFAGCSHVYDWFLRE